MWTPDSVARLRELAEAGSTVNQAARRLNLPEGAVRHKAGRLRLTFRDRRPGGHAKWLNARIQTLNRRVKLLADEALATRDRKKAPLIAEKARTQLLFFEQLHQVCKKWEKYLGEVIQSLEGRLLRIKNTLQNLSDRFAKRRAIEWKRIGEVVERFLSVLEKVLKIWFGWAVGAPV